MTKAVWTKFITDNAGAVVEGASVTVFLSDGITPAEIFSDPAGSAKANPFLTPAGGKAEFYADPGIYVIQASKDGKTATWNNEEIGHARRDLDLSDLKSAATALTNLGLGTAATKNVTTTPTDTTAGRLLKVGDWGGIGAPTLIEAGELRKVTRKLSSPSAGVPQVILLCRVEPNRKVMGRISGGRTTGSGASNILVVDVGFAVNSLGAITMFSTVSAGRSTYFSSGFKPVTVVKDGVTYAGIEVGTSGLTVYPNSYMFEGYDLTEEMSVAATSTLTSVTDYTPFNDESFFYNGNQVYHTGNILGTVSQSGGVPTGAVIERGSNVNGEYVKFADGTLICAHKKGTDSTVSIATGSIYKSASTVWNFPHTFLTAPHVVSNEDSGVSECWTGLGGGLTTNSSTSFQAFRATSAGFAPTISLVAIGRWY